MFTILNYMANEPQPRIFLSYAWANAGVADEIDNAFKAVGITFQRDVRDVAYAGNIKDFMNQVGKSDFVVMLISDEYVRSENCMYEVKELLNAHEFEKRILPVIINNAPVFKSDHHKQYYEHWALELKKANEMLARHVNEKTLADKRKIQSIHDYLGIFFQKITDLKSEKFENLKANNYRDMLGRMGIEQEDILERVLEISRMDDREDQELAFEEILNKYPDNLYALFRRAFYASEHKQYKRAKKYYEDLLKKYPDNSEAYNNLAVLYDRFSDTKNAKVNYEKAIQFDPKNDIAHYNLGILLSQNKDFTGAKFHYQEAIRINSQQSRYYYNYAHLLADRFNDYMGAKQFYEKAIEINPLEENAYFNLGNLLNKRFFDYEKAKYYLEEVIKINPQYAAAHNSLATLLIEKFSDSKGAKYHYEEAIKINSQHESAHGNLAIVLHNYLLVTIANLG